MHTPKSLPVLHMNWSFPHWPVSEIEFKIKDEHIKKNKQNKTNKLKRTVFLRSL